MLKLRSTDDAKFRFDFRLQPPFRFNHNRSTVTWRYATEYQVGVAEILENAREIAIRFAKVESGYVDHQW